MFRLQLYTLIVRFLVVQVAKLIFSSENSRRGRYRSILLIKICTKRQLKQYYNYGPYRPVYDRILTASYALLTVMAVTVRTALEGHMVRLRDRIAVTVNRNCGYGGEYCGVGLVLSRDSGGKF